MRTTIDTRLRNIARGPMALSRPLLARQHEAQSKRQTRPVCIRPRDAKEAPGLAPPLGARQFGRSASALKRRAPRRVVPPKSQLRRRLRSGLAARRGFRFGGKPGRANDLQIGNGQSHRKPMLLAPGGRDHGRPPARWKQQRVLYFSNRSVVIRSAAQERGRRYRTHGVLALALPL
jgi:hypothetical protein